MFCNSGRVGLGIVLTWATRAFHHSLPKNNGCQQPQPSELWGTLRLWHRLWGKGTDELFQRLQAKSCSLLGDLDYISLISSNGPPLFLRCSGCFFVRQDDWCMRQCFFYRPALRNELRATNRAWKGCLLQIAPPSTFAECFFGRNQLCNFEPL